MKRQDLLQEIRAIQQEMRKAWYDDIANKVHEFTVQDHYRYDALDNIASMLEAMDVDEMKDVARLITEINKRHNNRIFQPRLCAF